MRVGADATSLLLVAWPRPVGREQRIDHRIYGDQYRVRYGWNDIMGDKIHHIGDLYRRERLVAGRAFRELLNWPMIRLALEDMYIGNGQNRLYVISCRKYNR